MKKIKNKFDGQLPKLAISLEERLPPDDPLNKMGFVGKFLGVNFPTSFFNVGNNLKISKKHKK
jgi:hypothetical protein